MLLKLGFVFALLCCATLAAQAQFIYLGPTPGNRSVIHFDSTIPDLKFDVTDDAAIDVIFTSTGGINFNGALMPAGSAGTSGNILSSLGAGSAPAWTNIGDLAWAKVGNSGTDDTIHFIGTTDNQDLVFKTNGIARASFYSSVGTEDSGAFVPGEHNVYSLGTSTNRWKEMYLGPNSLRIGGFANGAKDGQSPQSIDEAIISFENGALVIDKDVMSEGSVLPNTDGLYDLGSPDNRWNDLYLTGNTIHMGSSAAEATMSYDDESHELSFSTDGSDDAEIIMTESDGNGQLGIGASPNTTLDVNGDAAFRFSNLALQAGPNSDVNVGASSAVRLTAGGAFEIHGLAGGQDGKVVELYNASGHTMRLFDSSATETNAANRIRTGTGHSFEVRNLGAVRLVYNTTDGCWIITSETRNTSNLIYTLNTYAPFTANQTAWAPDFGYIGHRISSNANRSISGISSVGVQDGTTILLLNVGTSNITLQNESNAASTNNRIITGTGNNEAIAPNKPATLIYDGVSKRWRIISGR